MYGNYVIAPTRDLVHFGKGHDDNPPGRGSGRYAWGSGKKQAVPKGYSSTKRSVAKKQYEITEKEWKAVNKARAASNARNVGDTTLTKKEIKTIEKARKVANANLVKARQAATAKKEHEAEKQRVLKEGSAAEVMQYKSELTQAERDEALSRIRWESNMNGYVQSDFEKGWKDVNNIMKKVGDVKDWTRTSLDLVDQIDRASKRLSGTKDSNNQQNKKNK
jgi:hypothetical protein